MCVLIPLVIAPAIAAALPGRIAIRLARFDRAKLLALAYLFIDLPLTLHAVAWDMITSVQECTTSRRSWPSANSRNPAADWEPGC